MFTVIREETVPYVEVIVLDIKLHVDGEEIKLNKFVKRFFNGVIVGAVTSLRGIKSDWREIRIDVKA